MDTPNSGHEQTKTNNETVKNKNSLKSKPTEIIGADELIASNSDSQERVERSVEMSSQLAKDSLNQPKISKAKKNLVKVLN